MKENEKQNPSIGLTGIILSAGYSSRMGKYKPLLEINGKSFVLSIAEKLKNICNKVVIVSGYMDELLRDHVITRIDKTDNWLEIIKNDEYKKGMFSSIKRGIVCSKGSNWVLLHSVDQPNIPGNFYSELLEQIESGFDWIQPVYKKTKGHPIIFNRFVCDLIESSADNSNLREISQNTAMIKKYWECNYKSILTDIDNQNDFKNFLKSRK